MKIDDNILQKTCCVSPQHCTKINGNCEKCYQEYLKNKGVKNENKKIL